MGLLVNAVKSYGDDARKMFDAGVTYMCCKSFAMAYSFFDRIDVKTPAILYNKAVCCFMADWNEECYSLLCLAQSMLKNDETGLCSLPKALDKLKYECCWKPIPILHEMSEYDSLEFILRLKAEVAFRLDMYEEVLAIASRLGMKYKHIVDLIDKMKYGNS